MTIPIPKTPDGRTTQAGAAQYLGLSRPQLSKLHRAGKGPARVQLGRRVYYFIKDLDEYIAKCRVTSEG